MGNNHANAYMLMYRIINANEDVSNLITHDDEIPEEVMADVRVAEVHQKIVQEERSKQSQRMQLKVLYGEELRVFYVDRRQDTYESLLNKVMQEFFGS